MLVNVIWVYCFCVYIVCALNSRMLFQAIGRFWSVIFFVISPVALPISLFILLLNS